MSIRKRPAFRQGRFGACEARLYEFHGRQYPSSSEEEKVERVAADSIYEGLVYLKRREPEFEVTSVQCIGLITLLSGSAHHWTERFQGKAGERHAKTGWFCCRG